MTFRLLAVALVFAAAGTARAGFAVAPYLQNRTDTTIVVRWTTTTVDSGRVDYGLTPGYGHAVSHSNATLDHELTLTGLLPDTLYHYRAISGADTSADAILASHAPSGRRIRFIAYSDTHGDSATNQSVINRIEQVEPRPEFLIHAGDVTASGSASLYRTFFNTERGLLCRAPVFPAIGNHDADSSANWHRFFALANNEYWYTFREDDAAFHALDPQDSLVPGSAQHNWLLSELLADSATQVRHIFVYVHTPPYTTNTSYAGNTVIQQYLCPLFERFGVAIVFCGHVHAYEHSLVDGVHYVTTGGGGASLSTGWNARQPWTVYREATYEFVVVDVAGDTVRTVGVRRNGSEFDTLVIEGGHVGRAESQGAWSREPSGVSIAFGSSRLRFTTAEPAAVSAMLYDATGRAVARLAGSRLEAGEHVIEWDRRALGPGVYCCVIRAGAASFAARLTVIR